LVSLSAQVAGVARTYVVPDFRSFINFLNALYSVALKEDRDGDGVEEIYNIYVTDLTTGDNIIIAETNVPDFWFEKNSALTSFESYTYSGVQYNLNASVNGATIGAAHILETDYSVIEEHASSASASASSAAASAANALQSENDAKAASDKAKASEVAAKESETAAASSATQAKNSADVAKAAEANVMNLEQRVSRNDKRITNLEKGITPEPYETDASVAYVKDVPEEALPYAEITKLGGMTRKCANLTTAQAVYAGADKYLETVVDGRNCIRFTSGYEKKNTPITFKPNTQYTASFYAKSENYGGADTGNACITFFYEDGSFSMLQIGVDTSWSFFTLTSNSGKTVKAIGVTSIEWRAYVYLDTDTFMLNEGTTALPYEPNFEGLRSAPTTEVESVGVNLFDKSKVDPTYCTPTETGFKFTNNNQQGAPTTLGKLKEIVPHVKAGDTITMDCSVVNGTPTMYLSGSKRDLYRLNPTTILEADLDNDVFAYGDTGVVCQYNEVVFYRGNNITYRPYTRNTLPIPEAVQALDGYGEGNPDDPTECNAILYEDGKGWNYSHKGDVVDNVWVALDSEELTDLNEYMSPDNYIRVEGGGTLTFKNQFGFDVPSEVTYQIKEATV
jgi:hypothetical protein